MGRKCFNCSASTGLHAMPADPELREKWISIIPNLNAAKLSSAFRLCSRHFEQEYFLTTSKRLRRDACPSMFLLDDKWTVIEFVPDDNNSAYEPIPAATSSVLKEIQNIDVNKKSVLPTNLYAPLPSTSSFVVPDVVAYSPKRPAKENLSTIPRRKFRYSGDINLSVDYTPRTTRKALVKCKEELDKVRKSKKNLLLKYNRLRTKVDDLEAFINKLEHDGIIGSGSRDQLNSIRQDQTFIEELKHGKQFGKYTPKLRQFAMTMSFYSTSGYEQLRSFFKNDITLPHIRTIRQWYQNTSGGPGITIQAIAQLKNKISSDDKQLYFSLMMDEMSIKKFKDWDNKHKTFVGFVDYGAGCMDENVDDENTLATNVLVLFLCAVNAKLKLPVAYFFIDSLNGSERAHIVRFVISQLIEEAKAKIINLTFDGLKANLTMSFTPR